jgi:hypothetical protein
MPTDSQGKRVNMKVGIWYNGETDHIHIQSSDFGGFISTVNRNPDSKRGNPNLFGKLGRCLARAGAPHPTDPELDHDEST